MKILVKDLTNQKLILALPALEILLAMADEVYLASADKALLARLQKLNLKLKPWLSSQPLAQAITVALVDSFDIDFKRHSETIFYPLIPRVEATRIKFQKFFANKRWVPLGNDVVWEHFVGDLLSLKDFIYFAHYPKPLTNQRLLITGGPTAEDIDPVRFITNRSSGKMGLALARAAFIAGAEVTFILGASPLPVPAYLNCIRVRSAQEMAEAVFERFEQSDIYIGAAAVADFKPTHLHPQKIKKNTQQMNWQLNLTRTIDILAELNRRKKHQKLVGFSVETEHEIENSRRKLESKGLDWIIINNPKHQGAAFGQETNKVVVLNRSGELYDWPLLPKLELSLKIMDLLAKVEK